MNVQGKRIMEDIKTYNPVIYSWSINEVVEFLGIKIANKTKFVSQTRWYDKDDNMILCKDKDGFTLRAFKDNGRKYYETKDCEYHYFFNYDQEGRMISQIKFNTCDDKIRLWREYSRDGFSDKREFIRDFRYDFLYIINEEEI